MSKADPMISLQELAEALLDALGRCGVEVAYLDDIAGDLAEATDHALAERGWVIKSTGTWTEEEIADIKRRAKAHYEELRKYID